MWTPSYDSKCGEFQEKFWERQWVFPDGSAGAMQETWVPSLGREDPLEEEMATHSSILA